jgi:hypothetical protein
MRLHRLTISLAIVIVSCSTVRVSQREKIQKDTELLSDNFKQINGTYSNKNNNHVPDDFYSLWQTLFLDAKRVDSWENAHVKLEVKNQSTLNATLSIGDTILQTRTITCKLKNGYISLKRQVKTEFLAGPFWWEIKDSKISSGFSSEINW